MSTKTGEKGKKQQQETEQSKTKCIKPNENSRKAVTLETETQ